jgi:2,3-bisphosphoglycerate-dependent phosphoglycerate mutase
MKTTVYLIRHGETSWNREERLQGQHDSPLTGEGIRQATVLAGKLSHIHFDAAYASDLKRARHTLQIITSLSDHLTVAYDARIRERNFGDFQGLTWKEIAEKFPAEAEKELSGNPFNRVPGGESKHQLLCRAVDFFNDIIARHPMENVLVVSHGGILNVWIRHVLQLPMEIPRRFRLANTAINIFEYDGGKWYVKTLGEEGSM